MSVEEIVEQKVSGAKLANRQVMNIRNVVKPVIDIEEADEYWIPREMYVKALINSPLDFATVTLSEVMGKGEQPEFGVFPGMGTHGEWRHFVEIDVAMHPQLGVLVCGSVHRERGEGKKKLRRRLRREFEDLEQCRKMLLKELEEQGGLYCELPPVGVFIALPGSKSDRVPRDWDYDKAHLCTKEKMGDLPMEMMGAMASTAENAGVLDYENWPRVMAAIQKLGRHHGGYTSALEWLFDFEAI